MISRHDKRIGVVILDKTFYGEKILKLISEAHKFKKLNQDPTLTIEKDNFNVFSEKLKIKVYLIMILTKNLS